MGGDGEFVRLGFQVDRCTESFDSMSVKDLPTFRSVYSAVR